MSTSGDFDHIGHRTFLMGSPLMEMLTENVSWWRASRREIEERLDMTERVSERIWRAAQAHFKVRVKAMETDRIPMPPWDGLRQDRRDIEYDAMVAAFGDQGRIGEMRDGNDAADGISILAQRIKVMEHLLEGFQQVLDDQQRRIDSLVLGLAVTTAERNALHDALKPFAEYAERIEKDRGLAGTASIWTTPRWVLNTPMEWAWFIAALKAYRREAQG